MEMVWIFYGKTEELSGRAEAGGEKGRIETRAGRILLGYALEKMYGLSLPEGNEGIAQLEGMLSKGKNGKPYLHGYPEIHFNISHSGEYAVCALAGIPVGIDIQIRQSVRGRRLLERTMNVREQEVIRSVEDPELAFAVFWAQKESYLKWSGEGITRDLSKLSMEDAVIEAIPIETGYVCQVCAAVPFHWEKIRIPAQLSSVSDRNCARTVRR